VSNHDLSSAKPWRESLERSRARRALALRTRRRVRVSRSSVAVTLASLTFAAGGAFAASSSGGTSAGTSTSVAATAAPVSAAAVQSALGVTADGVVGPITRAALRRFQRAHGLPVSGAIDSATVAALGLSGAGARSFSSTTTSTSTSGSDALASIAQCESGGNPAAVSPDGQYRGKYQFTRATWRSLGGHGDPAAASEATQDAMAAKLYAQRGLAPWPACGAQIGG